jgi:ORF6N domain
MVRLTIEEAKTLNRSQFVTGSQKHRNTRFGPYAFTEQGVAMLSSVLRSKRAVHVNIAIMRAFVRLREMLASTSELAGKLDDLEKKYDRQFKIVFDAIRKLMTPLPTNSQPIGFRPGALKK